jgi:sirohydrochlorin ferrochelatase
MRPLGRNDAMVRVCSDCDVEPARHIDREPVPYEPASAIGMSKLISKFHREHVPAIGRHGKSSAEAASPGFIVVRVSSLASDGSHRDRDEAYETLRGEPWFAELRRLGSVMVRGTIWHLFERPAVTPRKDEDDPLAAIECYRSTT